MNQNLSLYIHIPFCKRKCRYCDFLSMPCEAAKRELYVQALLMEIESYRESELASRPIYSVFIGGGTPSILETEQMKQILLKVKSIFNFCEEDCEITMELNPGTVSREDCIRYHEIGINRISIGLQSANDRELAELGRIHTFQAFLDTYQWLREAGFDRINVDLMSALPGQTLASYEETLQKVLQLRPEHISAYSLIIEEGTEFFDLYGAIEENDEQMAERLSDSIVLPLPDEDSERQMYVMTKEVLARQGYERYEISNYALPGEECRHNLVYWNRGEYLGLGLGSSSYLNGQRIRSESDLDTYIEAWSHDRKPEAEEIETLSKEDKMAEFMFLGLRLIKGVSEKAFYQEFGCEMMKIYGDIIQRYENLGLLSWIEERVEPEIDGEKIHADRYLVLTEAGIDVSNQIFAEFLL